MEKNASVKGIEGCGPALLKLNFLMATIDENDVDWLGKQRRAKRNVFTDLVSQNWPNDYSTFFNEFANMSGNGMEASTSTGKQTSFIMSSLNSAWKSSGSSASIDEYVANQLSQVHNTLVAARNGSVSVVRLFQLRTTIPDIISYQLLILNNFASKQSRYLNIISLLEVRNAPIPTLLSTSILLTELNKIRSIVSDDGLGFPMQLTSENMHFLLHMSVPKISLFRDQIFVTFMFPLISKMSEDYFTFFKVTSALQHRNGPVYSFVFPKHDVIAIDTHKERYVTLTIDDLNNCHQVGNNSVTLCKETSLPMSVHKSTECEIMILLKHQYPSDCHERYLRNYADIFIKVMQPNTWLVTMAKRSRVRYLCKGNDTIYETMTQINGLLTIDSDCKFFTEDVVIVGDNISPKWSVREHLIEKLKKVEHLDTPSGLEANEQLISNHVAQVIGFGETEKLLRISYSRQHMGIMRTLTYLTNTFDILEKHHLLTLVTLMLWVIVWVYLCFLVLWIHKHVRDGIKSSKTTTATSTPSLPAQPSAPTRL